MNIARNTFGTLIAVAAFYSSPAEAAVVYREAFGNSGTGNATFSSVNWTAYNVSAATPTGGNGGISNGQGKPADLGNLGQLQTAASTTNGYVFLSDATGTNNRALVVTSEYNGSIPLNTSTLESISIFQGNSTGVTFRVALQIGGTWYASPSMGSSTTITAATAFVNDAQQLTLNSFTSSNWTLIDLQPTSLNLGTGGQSLPDGDVTSFGIYLSKTGSTARFDTFEINAIPEPSAVMLLGLAAGAGLIRRRR